MRKFVLRLVALSAAGFTLAASAGSITNNFTTPQDYFTYGIAGDTNWDGVYLGFGDIASGGLGGSGAGHTLMANTTIVPGYLNVQTTGSDWAGNGDDGFYLWKLVSGDFDVSVETPFWIAQANNFGGLLVRAFNTNGSGAPVSFTATPASENFLLLWRGQEFSINQIRQATNGADIQNSFPDGGADTNNTRFFRITRVGDTFTFYWKTNQPDPWVLVNNAGAGGGYVAASGSVTRPDWHNEPVQVGIAQAIFANPGLPAVQAFTDFQLSGPNVNPPPAVLPNPPSSVVISSPNPSGSVNIAWTPGTGSDGSVVVVRGQTSVTTPPLLDSQPVQGITYSNDPSMLASDNNLSVSNTHVVFAAAGNNITVTGIGGTNNTYTVAVFSYSTVGGTQPPVYNTASPATNSFIGVGTVSSVSFTLAPTNIPVNGVAVAKVTATYSSGDSYDVSSDPTTVWSSSNPSVAIATNGTVTGIGVGSATITATYAGIPGSKLASTHAPGFVDTFTTPHDYLANGLSGSTWDGLYTQAGDVPGATAAGFMNVTNVTASIVTNNNLFVQVNGNGAGWEGASDNGFFLFKYVTNDFQVAMHITAYDNEAFNQFGLMARKFSTNGQPGGSANGTFPLGRETFFRWFRFDQFGISTSARLNRNDNNAIVNDIHDGETTDNWLLMVRSQGTNFSFFKRTLPTDPWMTVPGANYNSENGFVVLNGVVNGTDGSTLQVGIFEGVYTAANRTNLTDYIMIDSATTTFTNGTPPAAPAGIVGVTPNPDGSLTFTWTNAPGSDATLVAVRPGGPINGVPIFSRSYTANSVFGQGSGLGANSFVVYIGTGTSVTVTGLIPGTTYYAAAFSLSNTGPSYNVANAFNVSKTALGIVTNLTLTISGGNSLVSGNVYPIQAIATFTNGFKLDVSTAVDVFDPTNLVVAATNGILTASTNPLAPVTVFYSYLNVTNNNLVVTIHNPTVQDNFSTSYNYLPGSTAGTVWNGVYLGSAANFSPPNIVPGGNNAGDDGITTAVDANVTSNNTLSVAHTMTDWAGAGDDGFLLFRYVPGDFEVSVHMTTLVTSNYQFAGLMARAYGGTNDMSSGAPYNGSENWVYWGEFQQFADSTESRYALNGADNELPNFDGATGDFWLLMTRSGGTFNFYRRLGANSPYELQGPQTIVRPDLANVPVQVGLFAAEYTSNPGFVQYDSFRLNVLPPTIHAVSSGGTIYVSYPAVPTAVLQSSTSVSPTSWVTVPGVPGVTNGVATLAVPETGSAQFFRFKD